MVDYKYRDLFLKSHIDKQLKIAADDGSFTANNEDIHFEDFELTESLCSDSELRFGSCEAGMVKFQIRNAFIPLAGKWLTVTETLDGNTDVPFQYGRYKVFSDVPTADKEYRDITAYDSMYDILNADMAAWYNSILPKEDSTMTLRQFRARFMKHFGLEEVLPEGGLANDGMSVERTIEPEQLSGKDVITAICEINGCFGHIGRDGKFHYIYLPQAIEGLYPANDLYPDHAPEWMVQAKTGHLYPQDPKSTRLGVGRYIKCQYEDYRTKRITKLQIREKENDIGKTWPEGDIQETDNCYLIQNNFLVYGKSSEQLSEIAQNVLGKITDIVYRPFSATCVGNPCLEVGDPVRLPTKYEIVESYILKRTLKGIQALQDSYSADGVEKYAEKLNSVQNSIIQLKGKSNTLTRTIEETRLEMIDMGEGLSNTITVTARDIRGELRDTANGLSNTITATAGEIRGELQNEVNGLSNTMSATAKEIRTELKNTKEGLETTISTTADGIRADVSKTYETKTNASAEYTSIRNSISIESNRISTEIQRSQAVEKELDGKITSTNTTLSSQIEQTEKSIRTDVSETYQTKTAAQESYNSLSSSITQTAGEIRAEVSGNYETKSNAQSNYNALSSSISVNANAISLKVSKGTISSEISQEAGDITIRSNRITIESDNFKLSKTGEVDATGEFRSRATKDGVTYDSIIGKSGLRMEKNGQQIGILAPGNALGVDGVALRSPSGIVAISGGTSVGYICNGNGAIAQYSERNIFAGTTRFLGKVTVESNSGLSVGTYTIKENEINSNTGIHLIPNNGANSVYLRGAETHALKLDMVTYTPIYASAFTVKSTRKSKENFREIPDEEAKKILDIEPLYFDYIKGEKDQSGFIAEDIETIYPEICSYQNDEETGERELFGLDYSKFVPYIVKMLQVQQKEIDRMKKLLKEHGILEESYE